MASFRRDTDALTFHIPERHTQDIVAVAPEPISVIIPTLNEATNIVSLLTRLHDTFKQAAIPYEVIVVDDHSTDDTLSIVESATQKHALPVRVLIKQGKAGKSYSLIEGFAAARFAVLAMIDGDLQYPPEAVVTMAQQLNYADIVVADRRASYAKTNRLRGGLSYIFTAIIAILFGIDTDMQSGMKLFRRDLYAGLKVHTGKWSFDLYLVTHAIFNGFTLANVPIDFQERPSGVSKVVPLKVGTELLQAALQLKVRWLAHNVLNGYRQQKESVLNASDPTTENVPLLQLPLGDYKAGAARYADWLTAEDKYNNTVSYREETNEYIDEAMKPVMIKNRVTRTFAPFRAELSALRTFTPQQVVVFFLLLAACVLGLIFFKVNMVVGLIAGATAFYILDLTLTLVLSLRTLGQDNEEKIDEHLIQSLAAANWPRYTVLCPLYHEAAIVPQFVRAMEALDYPTHKLQILFLTEEDDSETREAIRAMDLPKHFRIVTVPQGEPRTKPRACNFGLLQATGDYIVIYDAEDIPDPLQLKKAVLAFANNDADLACVQAKLNFYNSDQNLLTRLFTAEYSTWFDITLPGLQRAQLAIPLGGTSNHFRTETLGIVGAWDAFNVTEDCDLGLRLSSYGLKTVILDSTTYEEANSQWKNWFRQRSRWIKGYMQTYLIHMRHPLQYLHPSRWRDFFSLQFIIGGKAAVLLINPLMWVLLIVYLFFHSLLLGVYHTLFPASVLYMGSLCLIFGNFLYCYLHFMGCLKRGQYKLVKWTLLIPLYWALSSVAAFIALYQLIVKPHYWEKTIHGLHLLHYAKEGSVISVTQVGDAVPALQQTQETLA